ncbi:thiamine pyrophosphate-dependent dehydrogenase E1 component subunit alpha, partial [Candidatus Sumerlaeota bacterium]|nr:thiamine pyrophosphate-dependent dehydrogenase E1 component subunit alpha [Candidatus Sumerlaeota bacterium]
FREFLISENVLTAERANQILSEVREAVEAAAKWAQEQPVPKAEDGLRNVFAEGEVPLRTS